jgi:phosphocarrier protein
MNGEPMNVGALPRARSCAVLTHEGGLHARPAIRLTQLAKRFDSAVWIAVDAHGPWIDAKSIARVMAMKTPQMATLHFAAEGDDADEVASALAKLVESDFAEVGADGGR